MGANVLLIDYRHKRWFLGTSAAGLAALVLYGWLDGRTPGGLTGGQTAGLWFGIAGSALMVFAGLLSALRKAPAWWWIGSRAAWLRGHIWLGLLSVVLILCHSGFRWGGLLTQALWAVFILTILTGIVGLILQQVLPRMITARVPCEAPYEQIPHLCLVMRRQAESLLEQVWGTGGEGTQASMQFSQAALGAKVQLQEFYEKHVRRFLNERYQSADLLANALQAETAFARLRALPGLAEVKDQIGRLEALCEERRLLAEQERLHHWLHGWLLVHVPLSLALLILGIAHVFWALYY